MTKNELLSFIAFKNEQEKEEAEFYMAVKGVELHRRILLFLGCSFSEKAKIKWSKIARILKTDKALRDVIYIYLATLEEYMRAFISNKYEDNIQQSFWIDGAGHRQTNKIKANILHGEKLFDILENIDFGCLIQQVKNLPIEDKKQLFGDFYSDTNLDAVKELRNAVSHHKLLVGCKLKKCFIFDFEGSTLIDNIKNLRQLLPERYRYGKNGKGGITAELNKIGIILD